MGLRGYSALLLVLLFAAAAAQDLQTRACANKEKDYNVPSLQQYQSAMSNLKSVRSNNYLLQAFKDLNWSSYNGTLVSVFLGMLIITILLIIIFFIQL